ncbi:uncharacterized protein NECHADRAFT_74880 [Fusarium vanettenii 77-13-4]|uniref:Uncharacterized protein n=1 Tax=Fusarium vanettenii (strain ATCC MYA-4622 / CBS 123669 / FGSC 9596 / NRRL 45880 / 77-13-4) TaxID=660122 RepID=C7YH82_FUSV7|nr:uncharacterized protein NECHADRAFT_74880 [Fusarium vanettenii 77-13-4]EEU48586.1 predicted protein [Fusarium vanettenii 77-13-4]
MDSANINQSNIFEPTSSASSSIILDNLEMSESVYRDKVNGFGVGFGHELPPPPTSGLNMSMIHEPTPAPEPLQHQDIMDEGWTIVLGASTPAGSETTRPASVSVNGSVHDLTASNVLRLDMENNGPEGSHPSVMSPGYHPKRSNTRATDMSPPDLSETYSPAAACDADGLCEIGAWADMAIPAGILAKNRRQMMK